MTENLLKPSDKKQWILRCALELLKENGDAGLSLRGIAERAGMRLSNVQYYFKSRDDILKTMGRRYFDDCFSELEVIGDQLSGEDRRAKATALIKIGLSHGEEMSDMCRIFRELWTLSTRNDEINEDLIRYYDRFSLLLADIVLGEGGDPNTKDRLRCLLVPYFEGYSITAPALPMAMDDVAEMLSDLAFSVLGEKND